MTLHTGWLLQVSYTLKSVALGSPRRYAPELSEVFGPHRRSRLEKRVQIRSSHKGAGLPVLGILEL